MHPIPSPPNGHAIGSEEVVPSTSELLIDVKSAMSAVVDLVPKAKFLLPGTTNRCMSWMCLVHSTRRRIAQGSGQQHKPSVDERAYAPTYRAPVQA